MIGSASIAVRPATPALYLVATPIGNLADITIRALETLAGVDIVACEDTRTTRILLDRYGIKAKTTAYHEYNAGEAGPRLVVSLSEGKSVALVSDAGTPLVSDPGYRLVEQALSAGIRIIPIPGPSAMLAALTASGLPTDALYFAGFLSARDGQRKSRLEELRAIPGTLIFYESPRRLAASLASMTSTLGADRPAAVCRELTKAFEEIRRGTLGELAHHYVAAGAPKGEVVICVAPPLAGEAPEAGDVDAMLLALAADMPAAKAAGEAAKMTGLARKDLFDRLVALKADAQR